MEYHLLSDELLVKLLAIEDTGAFNEIYKRYWKTLFKTAQQKIKSDEIIEELLQDVFLSIWEKRSILLVDNLGGYLFRSLKYQIIDHYRAQLLVEKYADFTLNKAEKYDRSVDEIFNFQEITLIFEDVFNKLPEKTRKVFHLSRLELKTTREISQILNISERSVEYHITQSLKVLREQLKAFLPSFMIYFFS
jgi:RNA polymerase sigma-70 factor (ECF subfamily)